MRPHPFTSRSAAGLSALALLLATLLVGEGVVAAQAITAPNVFTPLAQPGAFFPLAAQRVYEGDTGLDGGSPMFGPGHLSVPLTAAVPSGATAVAVNVTAFGLFPMQVTVCGTRTESMPWVCNSTASSTYSAYNPFQTGGSGVSLMATVALGPERTLTLDGLYAPGRVAVDLLGYYAPAGATPAAGRYRPGVPQRVLDTRDAVGIVEDRSITVSLGASVPADTSAVMATITVVDAERDSYVTTYPTGSPAPYASNVLVIAPTRTLSNQIVVPVSGNEFDLRVSGRAHVLVDVVGSFTSAASATGAEGLYVPLVSTWLSVPPRPGTDPFSDPQSTTLQPEEPRTVPFTAPVFGPPVAALSLIVEARPYRPGFVTVWAGGGRPWTTTLFNELTATQVATTTAVNGPGFEVISTDQAELGITVLGYYTA